ncbi:hypothetical protein EMIHUDRAFT_213051 [Emiliania huxleyi CCMP1516]|uniref:Rubisco LSMT substrate-binding domain-containing protein n=2 Tax=Emiliania huxleyi TaxID=2903 RepID=A0A0D3INL0_EMIH1|nr:hypothetical protein EMIHUDRAFT_213051 [Emiliania huxleyi CCMP1516]EOD12845.1 hypothetical protein EMIHUDRAFT_213051 [Emiliania huxleyi CCMP1516]|eukprot:XP_005765274.1 hypothetical protein EMIHUDRAFT_213051 [Emiliania huxleyi CCMP1516]
MPELPPYVPEFDLAFMSQMLGGGAVWSEPEDPATGDDETMMQEAAVDIALQLLTDDGGLQALLASDEPSAERLAELHRTIQLRSPSLNALSLRRYQTARILHASLHRWLD